MLIRFRLAAKKVHLNKIKTRNGDAVQSVTVTAAYEATIPAVRSVEDSMRETLYSYINGLHLAGTDDEYDDEDEDE